MLYLRAVGELGLETWVRHVDSLAVVFGPKPQTINPLQGEERLPWQVLGNVQGQGVLRQGL